MRTQTIDIDDAKDQLWQLITIVSEGGEVIIVQDGKPLARLVSAADEAVYQALPPARDEFSADEEPLAWEAGIGRMSRETRMQRQSLKQLLVGIHRGRVGSRRDY